MDHVEVKFVRLSQVAVVPTPAHGYLEDAGGDLRSIEEVTIPAGEARIVGTGLAIQLPVGYEAQIRSRSGLSYKGLSVANSPATVDAGYRGAIQVILRNHSTEPIKVNVGDRIAQIVIAQYSSVHWAEVDVLDKSTRDVNGLGSTGVK